MAEPEARGAVATMGPSSGCTDNFQDVKSNIMSCLGVVTGNTKAYVQDGDKATAQLVRDAVSNFMCFLTQLSMFCDTTLFRDQATLVRGYFMDFVTIMHAELPELKRLFDEIKNSIVERILFAENSPQAIRPYTEWMRRKLLQFYQLYCKMVLLDYEMLENDANEFCMNNLDRLQRLGVFADMQKGIEKAREVVRDTHETLCHIFIWCSYMPFTDYQSLFGKNPEVVYDYVVGRFGSAINFHVFCMFDEAAHQCDNVVKVISYYYRGTVPVYTDNIQELLEMTQKLKKLSNEKKPIEKDVEEFWGDVQFDHIAYLNIGTHNNDTAVSLWTKTKAEGTDSTETAAANVDAAGPIRRQKSKRPAARAAIVKLAAGKATFYS